MRLHDHRHVISAIPDGESYPRSIFLSQAYDIGFLLGRDTTANDRGGKEAESEEPIAH